MEALPQGPRLFPLFFSSGQGGHTPAHWNHMGPDYSPLVFPACRVGTPAGSMFPSQPPNASRSPAGTTELSPICTIGVTLVRGVPTTYPVRFLSHRSGLLSGYLGNRVTVMGILETRYGNHESLRVASKQVYKERILDS